MVKYVCHGEKKCEITKVWCYESLGLVEILRKGKMKMPACQKSESLWKLVVRYWHCYALLNLYKSHYQWLGSYSWSLSNLGGSVWSPQSKTLFIHHFQCPLSLWFLNDSSTIWLSCCQCMVLQNVEDRALQHQCRGHGFKSHWSPGGGYSHTLPIWVCAVRQVVILKLLI